MFKEMTDMARKRSKSKTIARGERRAVITRRIGIVSSIPYQGTPLETAFISGVNDRSVGYTILPPVPSYDFQSLLNAITTLDGESSGVPIQLIVTIGGMIVADAALRNVTQKPFLSIVGGVSAGFPTTSQGFFFGGINLQSFGNNERRADFISSLITGCY
jgi:hypothetical protein